MVLATLLVMLVCACGVVALRLCRLLLDVPSADLRRIEAEASLHARIAVANRVPAAWLGGGEWCVE